MFLKFLKKSAFGLDISDHSIEIVFLGGSVKKPRLLAMGRKILEPGIVENGKVLNKKRLETSLRDLIEKPRFGKIKTRKLIFALPESKSFIHVFGLPKDIKDKERLEYIRLRASQTFPFALSKLCLDYKTREGDSLREVTIIAAPRDIVNDYLVVFKNSKVQPLCLETESESLGRALIDTEQPVLITDIGARTTNFSFFTKGELMFSHIYEVAGNKFTESLAESLDVSLEEAESLKKEAGLNPGLKKGKVFLILQKEIQKIVKEIRKIEGYFQEKEGQGTQKIILAGGSAMLPHLPEYLTQNLQKPVVIGDPWVRIDIDVLKKKEYLEQALEISPVLYAACIGSALRGLAKNPSTAGINLIK